VGAAPRRGPIRQAINTGLDYLPWRPHLLDRWRERRGGRGLLGGRIQRMFGPSEAPAPPVPGATLGTPAAETPYLPPTPAVLGH
jgi:hypothetical protein